MSGTGKSMEAAVAIVTGAGRVLAQPWSALTEPVTSLMRLTRWRRMLPANIGPNLLHQNLTVS